MPTRFTHLNCKVETSFITQPNGDLREEITLSVDASCPLTLALEEKLGQEIGPAPKLPPRGSTRVRSTKYGFELVERR